MRPSDKRHLEELLALAAEGTANRSDVVALFILLRADAPRFSAVKDIGHSIAHDDRDRGVAHEYVAAKVADWIRFAKVGGDMHPEVLFPIREVIAEVSATARSLGLQVDEPALLKHWRELTVLLADVLDGTRYAVPGADVEFEGGESPRWMLRLREQVDGWMTLTPTARVGQSLLVSYAESRELNRPTHSKRPSPR